MEEDCRAVLRAPVRTLAVQSGWVVQFKKNIQQLHIAYFCRVEIKFHYFGVPRTVCANVLVTGSVELATLISNGRSRNAGNGRECGLDAPETSSPKCCFFHVHVT